MALRTGETPQDYMRSQYPKIDDQKYDIDNPDKFKDENMYKYHENT